MNYAVDAEHQDPAAIVPASSFEARWRAQRDVGAGLTITVFEGSVMSSVNSFGTRTPLTVGAQDGPDLQPARARGEPAFPEVARLPYSLKILLENLLRHEDGRFVKAADIEALAQLGRQEHGAARRSRSRRRACCCRTSPACRRSSISRRCATASSRLGGDPEPRQSAAAGRARHRSLGAGRLLRPARTRFS